MTVSTLKPTAAVRLLTWHSLHDFVQVQSIYKMSENHDTSLHRMVVLPALSSPMIMILIYSDPNNFEKIFEKTNPMFPAEFNTL